jgi:phosphoribosylaminoimidazole carboxylase (NCAIR synthetase)
LNFFIVKELQQTCNLELYFFLFFLLNEVHGYSGNGQMVIVCDDEDRENEADLVMAAPFVTEKDVAFMLRYTRYK